MNRVPGEGGKVPGEKGAVSGADKGKQRRASAQRKEKLAEEVKHKPSPEEISYRSEKAGPTESLTAPEIVEVNAFNPSTKCFANSYDNPDDSKRKGGAMVGFRSTTFPGMEDITKQHIANKKSLDHNDDLIQRRDLTDQGDRKTYQTNDGIKSQLRTSGDILKRRPIITITTIPAINTLKFLGVISKNRYVCLLSSSSGKFCTLPVANNRYKCLTKMDRPIVTTRTAILPTSPFLKGLNKSISNKPPNSPQTKIAKIQETTKFNPKGENLSRNKTR